MGKSTDSTAPFFLTRQSANILEDLSRLTRQPGTICLVTGRRGVGKTRLLQHFIATRAASRPVHWLSFEQRQRDRAATQGPGADADPGDDGLPQGLADGTLLIIDDFHLASGETRRGLLTHWLAVAAERGLNLIIGGDAVIEQDLAGLSYGNPLVVNSVVLAPLNPVESGDFLSARLCHRSGERLSMNREIRRRLKAAGGLFSELVTLADRELDSATCCDDGLPRRNSLYPAIAAFLAVALTVVLAYSPYWQGPEFSHAGNPTHDAAAPDSTSERLTAARSVSASQQPDGDGSKQRPVSEAAAMELSPGQSGQARVNPQLQASEPLPAHVTASTDTAGAATQPGQAVEASPNPGEESSNVPLLQARLEATRRWIDDSDPLAATIQIVTLAQAEDSFDALAQYLRDLQARGIDSAQVLVYQVENPRQGRGYYGVMFGEYADRQAAARAIDGLPGFLKSNKPIPRTVRGLRQEIARQRTGS